MAESRGLSNKELQRWIAEQMDHQFDDFEKVVRDVAAEQQEVSPADACTCCGLVWWRQGRREALTLPRPLTPLDTPLTHAPTLPTHTLD